jgi:hypothetical protein
VLRTVATTAPASANIRHDKALADYADFAKTSLANVKRVREDFFAKEMIDPFNFKGRAELVENALKFKYTATKLSDAQLDDLIRIPR